MSQPGLAELYHRHSARISCLAGTGWLAELVCRLELEVARLVTTDGSHISTFL